MNPIAVPRPDVASRVEAPPADAFRAALRQFASGVTVVATTTADAQVHATTASSFTSVSLDPALVLICLTNGSRALAAIRSTGELTVNLLSEEQEHLARHFADPWRTTGSLELRGLEHSPVTLSCRLYSTHAAGDHTIVVGEVTGLRSRSAAEPLVFHGGRFRTLAGGPDRLASRGS